MGLSLGIATIVSSPIQRVIPHLVERRFLLLAIVAVVAYKSSKASQ